MKVGGFLEFVAILVYIVLGLPELYNKTLPQTKQNKKPQNSNKKTQPKEKTSQIQKNKLLHFGISIHLFICQLLFLPHKVGHVTSNEVGKTRQGPGLSLGEKAEEEKQQ